MHPAWALQTKIEGVRATRWPLCGCTHELEVLGEEGRGGQSTIFAIKRSVPMSVKMQQTLEHKRIISSSDGPTKSHIWKSKASVLLRSSSMRLSTLKTGTKDAKASKRILARRKVSKCTRRVEPITSETSHCLCFANILAKARAVNQA